MWQGAIVIGMTNEEMLEDIKQLIAANNKVLAIEFDQKLEEKLEEKLAPIHQKIDDLAEFVQESLATSNDAAQEQLDNHEARITKLEAAAA